MPDFQKLLCATYHDALSACRPDAWYMYFLTGNGLVATATLVSTILGSIFGALVGGWISSYMQRKLVEDEREANRKIRQQEAFELDVSAAEQIVSKLSVISGQVFSICNLQNACLEKAARDPRRIR